MRVFHRASTLFVPVFGYTDPVRREEGRGRVWLSRVSVQSLARGKCNQRVEMHQERGQVGRSARIERLTDDEDGTTYPVSVFSFGERDRLAPRIRVLGEPAWTLITPL